MNTAHEPRPDPLLDWLLPVVLGHTDRDTGHRRSALAGARLFGGSGLDTVSLAIKAYNIVKEWR